MTAPDRQARDRATRDIETTLVVEAGAGTGKTRTLVERIERLIITGAARAEELVVITFTRAAASELRERVRNRLETRARDPGLDTEQRARVEGALAVIDHAALQTIDSFALSLLRERPLEAGLPPVIEPLDEVEAGLAFDEHWRAWVDAALDEGGALAESLPRAVRLGLERPVERLRAVAERFHNNYDLLKDAAFEFQDRVPLTAARAIVEAAPELRDLLQYSMLGSEDPLYAHIQGVLGLAVDLERAGADTEAALFLLVNYGSLKTGRGNQKNWWPTPEGPNSATRAKTILRRLDSLAAGELAAARRAALAPLLRAVKQFVLEYAADRKRRGAAEFHDLLVWAVELLAGSPSARRHFQRQYTRVLIDEFQDTDPLQLTLALLLTRRVEDGVVPPGALFVVGDPKQSIYRFRRADPTGLYRLRRQAGGESIHLTRTFRAHTRIVDWVNHVFGVWMGRDDTSTQPAYVDIETPRQPEPAALPRGVYRIGGEIEASRIEAVRNAEAAAIAAIARSVGAGAWTVLDDEGQAQRPSRYADLCILFPRRTSVPQLERALEDAGAPFTHEGRAVVFRTQEVRDLLACLTAIDDPSDEVALVAALRAPAFGCSDVDLFQWAQAGGRFNYLSPGLSDGGVAAACAALRRFHEERMRTTAPELIERFIRDRRLRELAYGSRRRRERLRLLQAVVEHARALADAGRPSLRDFLQWAEERARRGDYYPEGGIADLEHNAVRLMTIHHAKGLEFPIVLITGLNATMGSRASLASFDHLAASGPRVAVRIGQKDRRFEFGPYDYMRERDREHDLAEDARKLYVAATRARDYLIVSMFRKTGDTSSLAAKVAACAQGADMLRLELPPVSAPAAPEQPEVRPRGDELARAEWLRAREALFKRMARPTGVSATALKPPAAPATARAALKEPAPDHEDAPWRRGRAASAVGRAVHAVLQDVDLATRDGIARLARRHAAAEDIPELADEVERLAAATAELPVIRRAVESGRYWREVFVAAPLDGGGVLEGFIDLAFEETTGDLVVVDYKTDRIGEGHALAQAAAPYAVQLGAYAAAVEATTGRRVSEAWVVFARRAANGQDAEFPLPDLRAAMSEATALARRAVGSRSAGEGAP